MRLLQAIGGWLELRLGLRDSLVPLLRHPVPRGLKGFAGWWYVFGSATMTLLILQLVTGVLLAMTYVPSADRAYESLDYLTYQAPMGWFLRALHYYGSSGMVVMMIIHMTQVFLMGAHKYPRELTWLCGVGLFFLTLGMAFTGQILRWDEDAYWGVSIGAAIAGRTPGLGPQVVQLMLGGPIIAAATLSRFFALHVFILPGLLLATLVLHLYLVVKLGVSEPPVPGKAPNPETYHEEYERELAEGEPFFPESALRDAAFCGFTVIVVVTMAAVFGPYGPKGPPDPTIMQVEPRPDWPFYWIFALASLCPPALEGPLLLGLPVAMAAALLAVPFIGSTSERSARRRPIAVVGLVTLFTTLASLTWLGHTSPWSPIMDAWSGDPPPVELVKRLKPIEMQGAVVLQNKDCRNCHAIGGVGGKRGPSLDGVATRLDHDELVRQVVQGGGAMPAYGKQLLQAEVAALVSFLETLRPIDEKPAEPSLVSEKSP